MDSVLACMPSRKGSPEWGPFKMMQAACRHAAEIGRASGVAICRENKYGVAPCRNMGVGFMLADKEYTHLLFVDDDVYVPPDTIAKLLDARKDIVGGCYASYYNAGDLNVETYVVAWDENRKKIRKWFKGLRRVAGVGTGCILIRRTVLEQIEFPWFRWGESWDGTNYEHWSDDLEFCNRAGKLGFEIWAHGDVRCGHVKPVDIANFVTE